VVGLLTGELSGIGANAAAQVGLGAACINMQTQEISAIAQQADLQFKASIKAF